MISRRDLILGAPVTALATAIGTSWASLTRAAAEPRNPVACQTNAWQIKPGDFPELLARLADLNRLGFEAFECNVRFVKDQFTRSKERTARDRKDGRPLLRQPCRSGVPDERTGVPGRGGRGTGCVTVRPERRQ